MTPSTETRAHETIREKRGTVRVRDLLPLLALGFALTARAAADFAVLLAAGQALPSPTDVLTAPPSWPTSGLLLVAYASPFLLLAPALFSLAGCAFAPPRRLILAGAATASLAMTAVLLFSERPCPTSVLLLGTAMAPFAAAWDAAVPSLTRGTRLTPIRFRAGVIATSVAAALLVALLARERLVETSLLGLALMLNLLALTLALTGDRVWRKGEEDSQRKDTQGLRPGRLLAEVGRTLGTHPFRDRLLGHAALVMLAVASVAFLAWAAASASAAPLLPLALGFLIGALLTSCQAHLYRVPGLMPLGATLILAGLAWAAIIGPNDVLHGPLVVLGLGAALAVLPLRLHVLGLLTDRLVLPGCASAALANAALSLAALLGATLAWMLPPAILGPFLLLATTLSALLCWLRFARPALETLAECVNDTLYRVTARGPGLEAFPPNGPVLVIANHSCYADPIWLFKALPRPLTAMATSIYYDRPGLYQAARILGVLRVEASEFRREAPELEAAVAALDRGECVLLFPEGRVQRQQGQVRRFGQGVWRILQQRPQTPVVVCWIEGGWGSWSSYAGGSPFQGKPIDVRRPVALGVAAPVVLDPALLAHGPATRTHLRRACLEARRQLGLPPLDGGAGSDPAPSAAAPAGDPSQGAKSEEIP